MGRTVNVCPDALLNNGALDFSLLWARPSKQGKVCGWDWVQVGGFGCRSALWVQVGFVGSIIGGLQSLGPIHVSLAWSAVCTTSYI